jgi:hypothetical protein
VRLGARLLMTVDEGASLTYGCVENDVMLAHGFPVYLHLGSWRVHPQKKAARLWSRRLGVFEPSPRAED